MTATVRVANPAGVYQTRWTTFALPIGSVELRPHFIGGAEMLAVPGARLGIMSQLWHVRAQVGAGAVIDSADWQPATMPTPMLFALSRWQDLIPTVTVVFPDGRELSAAVQIESATTIGNPVVGMQVRLGLHAAGWHVVLFTTLWSWQEAVDIAGAFVWCDSRVPEWATDNVDLLIRWPGGRSELQHPDRFGHHAYEDGTWSVYSGILPDAVGICFRGTLWPAAGAEDLASEPLVAAAEWPDGKWFGLGVRRPVAPVSRVELDTWLAGVGGGMWSQRPGASNLDPGSSGNQACFGAQAGLAAAGGDPWAMRELLIAADDGILRSGHYLELHGDPVTRQNHLGWRTLGLATHKATSTDLLGKSAALPQTTRLSGRHFTVDDQHRGDGPEIAAYALTGDPLLQWDLLLRLNVDAAAASWDSQTIDAPRASGRLMQSWAKCAMVAPPMLAGHWLELAADRLELVRQHWPLPIDGMRPTWLTRDPRELGGALVWFPWQESMLVLGLMEVADVMAHSWSDPEPYFDAAQELAEQVIKWGARQVDGAWACAYAVEMAPGNQVDIAKSPWWDWMASSIVLRAGLGDPTAALLRAAYEPQDGSAEERAKWWPR